MKKLCTLIKASMTEGMNIFKIKSNKNRSNLRAIVLITILLI